MMILYRSVHERKRYYKVELIPNLFGEYLLIRTYGAYGRAKPTRVICDSYPTVQEAKRVRQSLIRQKQLRGYSLAMKL